MSSNDTTSTEPNWRKNSVSSCRPPANTTYLAIGQDLFSINEYVMSQYNHSLHHLNETNITDMDAAPSLSRYIPAAFMVYTDLQSLNGLWKPTDYGSGVEYADGTLNLFPNVMNKDGRSDTGLQIGLWLNGTSGCFSTFTGKLDEQIQLLVEYLSHTKASKVFLRVGYEFDNPSFGYDDPAMYILAYRHIVASIREFLSEEANERVLFVWHSWGAPISSKKMTLDHYYPGDKYVDWVGVSLFQQVFPWGATAGGGSIADVENVLKFASARDKPIMIAESTPFGGIELKQSSKTVQNIIDGKNRDFGDEWNRWYGKVMDVINKYDISMWCYINADWESQPMWHGVGFGETRIASNKLVMAKWQEQVINNGIAGRKFLMSGSLENCGVYVPDNSDKLENLADDFRWDRLSHIGSFIVIPFLLVGAVFYFPFLILGESKSSKGGYRAKRGERKHLLADIDKVVNTNSRPILKASSGSSSRAPSPSPFEPDLQPSNTL